MEHKDNWIKLLEKYAVIKELYIECEETDPELQTNIQPLNEFRAALDHIMKMATAYYVDNNSDLYTEQYCKLHSHLDRAFYDISDMLCLNYRNKIIDILETYEPSTIKSVLPLYYSEWYGQISKISDNISKYRMNKGTDKSEDINNFNKYRTDVLLLKSIYVKVRDSIPSLEELHQHSLKKERKNNHDKWIGWIIAIISIIAVVVQYFSQNS